MATIPVPADYGNEVIHFDRAMDDNAVAQIDITKTADQFQFDRATKLISIRTEDIDQGQHIVVYLGALVPTEVVASMLKFMASKDIKVPKVGPRNICDYIVLLIEQCEDKHRGFEVLAKVVADVRFNKITVSPVAGPAPHGGRPTLHDIDLHLGVTRDFDYIIISGVH